MPPLTAFGKWDLHHGKIIGINIIREAAHVAGARTYVNNWEMFMRFANKEYLEEYVDAVAGCRLKCDVTGKTRYICTRVTHRDLEVNMVGRGDYMTRPRFFEEVWNICSDS